MWLHETLVRKYGVLTPALDQLPLRNRALLDVAIKAGLGKGRTMSGVLTLLREQSSAISREWRMLNLMDRKVVNDHGEMNANVVALLVDSLKENRELRLVSRISRL